MDLYTLTIDELGFLSLEQFYNLVLNELTSPVTFIDGVNRESELFDESLTPYDIAWKDYRQTGSTLIRNTKIVGYLPNGKPITEELSPTVLAADRSLTHLDVSFATQSDTQTENI